MWLILIIGLLFIVYTVLIVFYTHSWKQLPDREAGTSLFDNTIRFSIIIPARNEANNIAPLLQSLLRQNYPLQSFEVIVVDDHSTDNTAKLVEAFSHQYMDAITISLIALRDDTINSYKKKAIETGIAIAANEWIVCTDADCIVPENWLASFATFITEKDPVFIAAPVSFISKTSVVGIFQDLDFLTLQGITGASVYKNIHSMCNGANLAYKKNIFYEVGGFKGIDTIASGDDMLLMHKIWEKYPDRIQYLKSKNAIVLTAPAATWKAFFNQRIRWASKATSYDDKRVFTVLLLVYLFNFSFLILLVGGCFNKKYLIAFFAFWIAKTIIELPFIKNVATFFNKQELVPYFFIFQPLHIGYTIIAGFLGSFGKYEWKGRTVK